MRYLLLVYSPEDGPASLPGEGESVLAVHELEPVTTATSVRIRADETLLTDGPFTATAERLGGICVVEVESLDEALELAERIPAVREGTVEIRPVAVRREAAA